MLDALHCSAASEVKKIAPEGGEEDVKSISKDNIDAGQEDVLFDLRQARCVHDDRRAHREQNIVKCFAMQGQSRDCRPGCLLPSFHKQRKEMLVRRRLGFCFKTRRVGEI